MKPILLVLSGGGIRAMAFHAGVLRYLAQNDALERITKISSVSGGSLLIGLLFQQSDMRWPSSRDYLSRQLPVLKSTLTSTNLESAMVHELCRPKNWKFALSRANILALAIGQCWNIGATLEDVPATPIWSINGTTAETGKRFRFKGCELRDWTLGTTYVKDFPLRDAMAVSAAFPGLIGPYVLNSGALHWELPLYTAQGEVKEAHERFQKIHLYDGGVYDNLGLEAFFDAANGPKTGMEGPIVVSDAGAPLPTGFNFGRLNVFRLKHVADIMADQVRSLRVRTLVNYALNSPGNAAYLRIGDGAAEISRKFKVPSPAGNWMDKASVAVAASFPTRLMRLTEVSFDLLEQHGFESAALGNAVFKYL